MVAIAAFGASSTALAVRTGSIHPGVQTFIAGAQCTANFIFRDAAGTYVGLAAHCAGTGAESETNGCSAATLALGTPVAVTGAAKPGVLVYSSWVTMQIDKETDPDTCEFNDFALVKIDPADTASVNPSLPGFGGPTGVGAAATGATVFSYGNSSLRMGVAALSPKQGVVVKVTGAGWGRTVLTLTPGIPGDSGSGFVNAGGQAIGVLSTLSLAPLPLTNGSPWMIVGEVVGLAERRGLRIAPLRRPLKATAARLASLDPDGLALTGRLRWAFGSGRSAFAEYGPFAGRLRSRTGRPRQSSDARTSPLVQAEQRLDGTRRRQTSQPSAPRAVPAQRGPTRCRDSRAQVSGTRFTMQRPCSTAQSGFSPTYDHPRSP